MKQQLSFTSFCLKMGEVVVFWPQYDVHCACINVSPAVIPKWSIGASFYILYNDISYDFRGGCWTTGPTSCRQGSVWRGAESWSGKSHDSHMMVTWLPDLHPAGNDQSGEVQDHGMVSHMIVTWLQVLHPAGRDQSGDAQESWSGKSHDSHMMVTWLQVYWFRE